MLPDNDIDVQLAKKLAALLDANTPAWEPDGNDPLESVLLQLKASHLATKKERAADEAASIRMWQQITAATKPAATTTQPQARIFTLKPAIFRMAVAACLLAAVAISWLLITRAPAPQLLAEAATEITVHTLSDGSTVTLRPNSKLFAVAAGDQDSHYKLEGEGFFDVTHNENRTFAVIAGDAQVAVLGTMFNVSAWRDDVTVYLQEGRVELKNQNSGQAVILSPGQSGTVDKDQVTLNGQPANPEVHLDWMDEEIAFFEATFQEVVDELSFHFAISIEIPDERANETISGSIGLQDETYVINSLSTVLEGGSFVQTGEHTYRFEAN